MLALVPGHAAELTGEEPPGRRAQVPLPGGDRVDGDVGLLHRRDEPLQLQRRAMQPVGMPGDDHVDAAGLDRLQEREVARPPLARVRRHVVVQVGADYSPAAGRRQGRAFLALAIDAEPGVAGVTGNAAVEGGSGRIVRVRPARLLQGRGGHGPYYVTPDTRRSR